MAACGDDKYEQIRSADLIFESGSVYTMDPKLPEAEAVAVKEGKIVYVGDDTGLKEWRGKDTQIINLKGKMLLPGFVDTHNHAYLRAENIYWVNLEAPSLDSYKAASQNFLAKQPEAKQVRGVGWNLNYVLAQAKAAGRSPAQLLDEIVGKDIPAVFITHGHHEVWANTRAMQNAGINATTPDPVGAFIDRDSQGTPTGIFREFAPLHYPTDSFLDAIKALDTEGELTVRYDLLQWADETRGTEQIPGFVERRVKYHGKFFKTDSIKIFGTGASSTYGSVVWDQEVLKKTVAALDREKFRIYIHDIGPTSTYNLMLDALEYAQKQNGKRDARHMITHVSDEAIPTIPRFLSLGIRADGHPLPKAFFDTNVQLSSSSDYPVREFYPMTRISAGVQSGIPLSRMLASHTINGAEAIFAENETGSIEVGKAADLVVMSHNLYKLKAEELENAQVLMTMFNGKILYDAQTDHTSKERVTEQPDSHDH